MRRALFVLAGVLLAGVAVGQTRLMSDSSRRLDSGPALPSGYLTIRDEGGAALTQRATINCVGAGIVCSDDAVNGYTTFTIAAGGGGFADPGGNGVVVRTALNVSINRVLSAANTSLTITNGDGVAGNPTFSTTVNTTDDGGAVVKQGATPGTAQTGNFNVNGVGLIDRDDIRTTVTDGFKLINNTASDVVNTVQLTPALVFSGAAWNSSGAASQTDAWRIRGIPATVAGTTTQTLSFDSSINGGAYSTGRMTLSGTGSLTTAAGITTTAGNFTIGTTSNSLIWNGRGGFTSTADGNFQTATTGGSISASQLESGAYLTTGANNSGTTQDILCENLTLATGATTTDTAMDLPANSIIDAVTLRITTGVTTAATLSIGDPTVTTRFSGALSGTPCGAANITTIGSIGACTVQWDGTGTSGNRQTATAKIRVTTNVNPGAGAIRLCQHYHTFTPPTS